MKVSNLAVVAAMLVAAGNAEAQLYTVSQYSAPFVPLTGGTAVPVPTQDDGAAMVPIGFGFPYYGQVFNHVNVAVNGHIWLARPCSAGCNTELCNPMFNACGNNFGSTTAPTNNQGVPFPTDFEPNAIIAAYWDDLILNTNAPAGALISQTIGVAPNRTFVVEWRNIRHFPTSVTTLNFQIRLQESGVVQIHYGTASAGPDTLDFSGNIGSEDPTGTVAVVPNIPCANIDPFGGACPFSVISGLANQVIEIGLVEGPELTGSIHPPPGGDPGTPISVNVRVRNIGTDTTTSGYAADVYFSSDETITTADTYLGRLNFPITAANQTRSATLATNVPGMTAPGAYYLGAIIDPLNVVPEVIAQNNTVVSRPFLVGPDLLINLNAPATTGPGEMFAVELTVDSVGSPVANAGYDLYFSTDQNFGGDTRIGTGTIAVGGQARVTVTVNGLVPNNIIPGNYYVIARIDPRNRIAEVSEMNNTAVTEETSEIVGPDVVAVDVSGLTTVFRGEMYHARATIRNAGGARADNLFYSFHLSDNQLITISDPMLGEIGPISLTPGQTITVEHDFAVSATIAAGQYYLGLIADSQSAVLEQIENNNIKRMTAQVTVRDPAPDLTVNDIALPPAGAAGETLVVERVLENIGNALATFTYSIYLSSDTMIDPTKDARVGQGTLTLDRFEQGSGTDLARIPSAIPAGTYYIAYVLDEIGAVPELNETNNIRISGGSIPIEPGQLMIVTRGLPPATVGLPYQFDLAARGGTGTYTWSITGGVLPDGLTLDEPSGRISGNPEREGTSELIIAVDDGSQVAEVPFALVVTEPTVDLEIITRAIPPAFVGRPFEFPLTAIGGVPPYVWTTMDELPAGLTLTEDGLLSGTAVEPDSDPVTFQVHDAVGASYDRVIIVRVVNNDDALKFSVDVLRDGVVGKPYDDKMRAENGDPPYVFSFAGGELPPGLMIDGDSVRGTPNQVGTYTFAVRVTDVRGDFDLNRFTVSIEPDQGVRFATIALPPGMRGFPYAASEGPSGTRIVAVTTATDSTIVFEVIEGSPPPGIMVSSAGFVAGLPTESGTFVFTVQATDSLGQTAFRALSIVIIDPPEDAVIPPAEEGCGCTATKRSNNGLIAGLVLLGAALALRRKKRGFLGLILTLGVFGATNAQAQVPYFFQDVMEPYVERTGGTPLVFSGIDDGDAQYTLPFAFRFYDQTYTNIAIGTNGYISFDGDAASLGNSTFPDPDFPNNVISLMWDDLINPIGTVHIEGMAPQRVAIIQWSNVAHFGSGGLANFQLWLYEGGAGRFELRYGPFTTGGQFTASVGFENGPATQGHTFLSCTPNCGDGDLDVLEGRVFRALQDAGTDVIATSISSPPRVFAGSPIQVSSVIQSFHQQPLGPFRYQIHLVPVGQTTLDNPVFTSQPITLAPYQTLTTNDSVIFPVDSTPGRYRVALVTDSASQISEPDETNNIARSAEFLIGERRPDLTVPQFGVMPLTAQPGDRINFDARIRNAGNLNSPPAEWRVALSPNRVISVDDRVVESGTVAIPLLTTATVPVSIVLPSDLVPGRYYVGILVDPTDQVRELSEVNNAGASRDPIAVGVDFLEIATSSLPGGYIGVEYSAFLRAAGGDGIYRWELASGTLPRGLTLLSMSGEIRGRPTEAANETITLRVISAGRMATRDLNIQIAELGGALTIVTRQLLPGVVGQSYPPLASGEMPGQGQRIRVVNAMGTVNFSLIGSPPPGLMLDADGYLHGVPLQQGVFDVGVQASDGTATATRTIPLTVVEPGRLTLVAAALPDAILEEEYRVQLQVVGRNETSTISFMLGAEDAMPDGLSLTTTGLIVGTPQRTGTWDFAVTVVEGNTPGAPSDSANFTLTVVANAGFGITPSSLPVAEVGKPYDATLEARGGNAPFVWRLVIDGTLPTGLRFEVEEVGGRERARFLGTPEAVPLDRGGATPFVVTVEDVLGRRAMAPMAIRVVEPPAPPPVTPADSGGCSCATSAGSKEKSALGWIAIFALAASLTRRFGRRLR